MIKRKVFLAVLNLALLLPFIFVHPAIATVQRDDDYALGDKLEVPVYEWRDSDINDKAIIVAFHGMTFYGLAFDDVATYLAAHGYPVYAYDFRGFGRWQDTNDKYSGDGRVHFTASVEDGEKLIQALRENNPHKKIFCLGESLGSNLILAIASHESELIDGAILCGLGVKRIIHAQPRFVVDALESLTDPDKPVNLKPYIKPYLSLDPSVTKTYMNDPEIHRQMSCTELIKATITNKRSIKDVSHIPPTMPILIVAGEKDEIYNTSALPAFVRKLGTQNATLKIIPGKGHLLLELQPVDATVTDTICPWLDKETGTNKAVQSKEATTAERTL